MGKLFNQIKKDVELLNDINTRLRNNEALNMHDIYAVRKALLNVRYVVETYGDNVENPFPGVARFAYGKNRTFNIPDDFEKSVDKWEKRLDEGLVDEMVDHIKVNQNVPDYVPELNEPDGVHYFGFVRDTLEGILPSVTSGYLGINSEGFRKIVLSATQDYIKTATEQNYVLDPKENPEVNQVLDWLDHPISNYVAQLGLQPHDEAYFEEVTNEDLEQLNYQNGHDNVRETLARNNYFAREMLKLRNTELTPAALSKTVKEGMDKYFLDKGGKGDLPSFGEYLAKYRDKLEDIVLDGCLELEDDPDSEFLREYLSDPVNATSKYYEDKANEPNQKNARAMRNRVTEVNNARNDYNQARGNRANRWGELETQRRDLFERYLREEVPGYDPNNLENEYKGGRFERMLNRTSKEWKNVESTLKNWKNEGPDKGNLSKANNAATAYLKHKFPKMNPNDITEEMAMGLRGVGRHRAMLCLSVLKASGRSYHETWSEKADEAENRMNELRKRAGLEQEVDLENNNQLAFQEILKEDVEIDKNNNNIIKNDNDNNIIENDLDNAL